MTKEKTAEAIRNTVEPWVNAMNMWAAEGDKIRKTALDGMYQTIDNGHKLAKESLSIVNSLTDVGRKQVRAQVERTVEMVTAFLP